MRVTPQVSYRMIPKEKKPAYKNEGLCGAKRHSGIRIKKYKSFN